jgi:hypothetical protein
VEAAVGFLAHEYDYTSGGELLRLSAGYTPAEAKAVADAYSRATGLTLTPVT